MSRNAYERVWAMLESFLDTQIFLFPRKSSFKPSVSLRSILKLKRPVTLIGLFLNLSWDFHISGKLATWPERSQPNLIFLSFLLGVCGWLVEGWSSPFTFSTIFPFDFQCSFAFTDLWGNTWQTFRPLIPCGKHNTPSFVLELTLSTTVAQGHVVANKVMIWKPGGLRNAQSVHLMTCCFLL